MNEYISINEKPIKLNMEELDKFYSAKYETYRKLSVQIVTSMITNSVMFFILDCIFEGRFVVENLFPRLIMLIFIYPYITIVKNHNYKTNIVISYLIVYGIGACNIWSMSNLENAEYLGETFLVIQIALLPLGLGVPKDWSKIGHIGLLIESIIASAVIKDMDLIILFLVQSMTFLCISYVLGILESNFLENYTSSEKIVSRVVHDPLTKAFNRHLLDDISDTETNELNIERASILMIDIDFFKKINDTYGHDVGDVVLQNLVEIIRAFVKKTDFIIRWGGEEFVVILPDCGEIKAKEIAEKMRNQVISAGENMCNTSISVGIATYSGGDYNETIKKADKALYYAKEHGRNQVIFYNNLEQH